MSHVHGPILPTPDSAPGTKDGHTLYQDNVAYMDKLVGKLLAELDRLKLREKTLLVFASDNGTAPQYKEFCTIKGGKQLSGCKHTMLECGALVPMIVSWPGTTPSGRVSQNFISFCDFFPTFAEVAGATVPAGLTIDGRPLTPLFHGQTSGDWTRNWIFVLLRREWYDRELNWKLNQSGNLFDMRNAPYTEPLVPPSTQDKEALAARQRLQAVLDQLDPAAGKVDPGDGSGKHGKKRHKNGRKGKAETASANTNAPDQ